MTTVAAELHKLPDIQKIIVFDKFVEELVFKQRNCNNQIISNAIALDMIADLAIELGYIECPHCHHKGARQR